MPSHCSTICSNGDHCPHIARDGHTYNIIVDALCGEGMIGEAEGVLEEMLSRGGLCKVGRSHLAQELFIVYCDAADGAFSSPHVHGAGHVDLQRALSLGLVYDILPQDYVTFLCSLDYTIEHVRTIVKHPNVTCSRKFKDPGELNYPSFSVVFGGSRVVRYTRELTNVGAAGSVYQVMVSSPAMVNVMVQPRMLVFKTVGAKQRYTVTFVTKKSDNDGGRTEFGSLAWSNTQHHVSSPIAFAWTQLGA